MKIFVFSTHPLWPPHIGTELEIIQNHLDKGDQVYRFVCNGDLPACDVNENHTLSICLRCKEMSMCGKKLLSGNITDLPLLHSNPEINKIVEALNFSYTSLEELKSICIDNFDIGLATVSSVISWFREPELNIEEHRKTLNYCLTSSAQVYYSTLEYIKDIKPDVVYAFNGRLAHVKPILRACQRTNVECNIHERGHSKGYYELYKNTTPHDRKYVVSKMKELWDNAISTDRITIGESFYKERVAGKEQGWFSFTKTQQKGLLPANWDENKKNIVIFNSSEDEFASIGPDWKNDLYPNQLSAIKRIVVDSQKYKNVHFYLRVHPNLSNLFNSETKAFEKLDFPNLTVINAESNISSYDLLFNCEKALAFGSSVGIEAVFWGKPSIQAGKSFYYDLDATYKPQSHEELIEMIDNTLEPLSKTPALIFGYYYKTFGIPFHYYKANDLFTGTFKRVDMNEKIEKEDTLYKRYKKNPLTKWAISLYERGYQKNKRKIPAHLLNKDNV